MLNAIYLYVEHFNCVWEPAEGGYFVETSFIDTETIQEFNSRDDAMEAFNDRMTGLLHSGYKLSSTDTRFGFDDETGFFRTPEAEFNRDGSAGSGFALHISLNEPRGREYDGYQ